MGEGASRRAHHERLWRARFALPILRIRFNRLV
jgi:hypothetical protein